MRSLKNPVIALPTALVLLIIATTAAEACFRCRERVVYQPVPVVQQQVVTQVVQVPTRPNNENTQVIRALVIIDNNDPDKKFDRDVKLDGMRMLQMLFNLEELCPNPKVLLGKEVTRDKIMSEIQYGMEVGRDDTLFVFYIGHGKQTRDPQYQGAEYQMGHYLDLQLASKSSTQYQQLWRSELLRAMKAREPRLAVLITDSCFASSSPSDDSMELKSSVLFKAIQSVPETKRNVDIVRHLFLDQRGVININSCMPTEVALGTVFTPTLVDEMTGWAGGDTGDLDPSWEVFFNYIKKKTQEKATAAWKAQSTQLTQPLGPGSTPQTTQTPYSFESFGSLEMRLVPGQEESSREVAPAPPAPPFPSQPYPAVPPPPAPFPGRGTT
jgi:hypothetical protein